MKQENNVKMRKSMKIILALIFMVLVVYTVAYYIGKDSGYINKQSEILEQNR